MLLQNIHNFDCHPNACCQLFDTLVAPILSYSCEEWGYTKTKLLERIHLKYCKKILNVKMSMSNVSVYRDLGRYRLYIRRYVRMLKYWFKRLYTDNCVRRHWKFHDSTVLQARGTGCIVSKIYYFLMDMVIYGKTHCQFVHMFFIMHLNNV